MQCLVPLPQHVRVSAQQRQRPGPHDRHVCVDQQQVFGLLAREPHQLGAVVSKVDPGSFVKLARYPVQRSADQLLRAVS
jgi:hypothetical protein